VCYLANGIRPDIAFAINLLARFSSASTKRHWSGVKRIKFEVVLILDYISRRNKILA
jgi:hypothetical protein